MKLHTIITLTSGSVMLIGSHASASYLGLQVTFQQVPVSGTVRNVYRVYALFSDPGDYLTEVCGSPALGNLVIQSRNTDGTAPGSNFVNVPGGGPTAPTSYYTSQNPNVAFDTFVTIGFASSQEGDHTMLKPGWNGIGDVMEVNSDIAGWFIPGLFEQGRAGFLGDGDPLLRVLMMQLTVSSTSTVRGTLAVIGHNNFALAGLQPFTVTGQTFNSISAPGLLPLIGLAALNAKRRRHRMLHPIINNPR